MPAGNRQGPWGAGPRSGRALGFCEGYPNPGYMTPSNFGGFYGRRGRGFGRGMGFGFGRGAQWRGTMPPRAVDAGWDYAGQYRSSPQDERHSLESQAGMLKEQLDFIQKRLNELQKPNEA